LRFVVLGAGGIGSTLGGMLARHGEQVCLVALPEHVAAVRRAGLEVVEDQGTWRARVDAAASVAEASVDKDDVCFLTCKSYDSGLLLGELASALPSGPAGVICVQNGVHNEEAASAYVPRVYGAMARFSARLLEPGRVFAPRERGRCLVFGRYPDGVDSLAEEVAERCRGAGFEATTSRRIMAHKWAKLVSNCPTAAFAVTDTPTDRIQVDPVVADLMNLIMCEAQAVLDAAGVDHEPVDMVPVPTGPATPATAGHGAIRYYGSTWNDLQDRLGRTEAPYFNGVIVELARRHGRRAPVNGTLLMIVNEMAVRREPPGRHTPTELLEILRAAG
jgi:2-dehydropantoate 2-reductase